MNGSKICSKIKKKQNQRRMKVSQSLSEVNDDTTCYAFASLSQNRPHKCVRTWKLCLLCSSTGIVQHECLPQGQAINKECYLQVQRRLREAIRKRNAWIWETNHSWRNVNKLITFFFFFKNANCRYILNSTRIWYLINFCYRP